MLSCEAPPFVKRWLVDEQGDLVESATFLRCRPTSNPGFRGPGHRESWPLMLASPNWSRDMTGVYGEPARAEDTGLPALPRVR